MTALRPPPHDVAAEAVVVAACLLEAGAVARVRGIVAPGDCYDPRHGAYLEAALELDAAGAPVDAVAAVRWLRERGRHADPAELGHLLADTPAVAHLEGHARAIRAKALLRRGIEACRLAAASGYDAPDAAEWARETAARLQALELEGQGEGLDLSPGPVDAALAAFDRALDAGGDVDGLPTGFVDLDHNTGLLAPEEFAVIAARPGMGKTSFVGQLALNVASRPAPRPEGVVFVTAEMPAARIAGRLVAAEARVPAGAARRGWLTADQAYLLRQAAARVRSLPLAWFDCAAPTVGQVEAACRAARSAFARRGGGLALVIVDYLQLLREPGHTSREQEVAAVSRGLAAMAKRLKAPVVCCAQLNRAVEGRASKRPVLSDLRESGAIEQDAWRILFLHRPDYYDPAESPGLCEVITAKNREGATGDVALRFDASCTRFDNLERSV